MGNRFRNFMMGRYGPDQLCVALFIAALAVRIIATFLRFYALDVLSFALLIYGFFRFFSRNIEKRRRENDVFLRYWGPARFKLRKSRDKFASRKTHKFFTCPNCKNTLRVPKGKGRIQITCPKCGERFERKS